MERAELSAALGRPAAVANSGMRPVLISEADPARFMAAFADAVAGGTEVFLCDPSWGKAERAQLEASLRAVPSTPPDGLTGSGWLMIPTGGSSGQLKFARHDQTTLACAARGFLRHFSLSRVNAAGVLPLHHVSGLMAWLRCALTGGEYRHLDWKKIEGGELPELPSRPDGWVISLVPTQLERLLGRPEATAWLQQFRIIFLGGAAAWPELLDRAMAARLPLSLGYGMTETSAMATALRPEEFQSGLRDSGAVLPHARVWVASDGTVSVSGESLFHGYYPQWELQRSFVTGDLGRLDGHAHLTVLGRRDGVIISGGEKIQPAEVETALRSTKQFRDVVVLGVADAQWGQAVVAAYPVDSRPDLARVEQTLKCELAAYKRPKRYVPLSGWPVTAAGKVNRGEVLRLIREMENR